MQNNNYDPQSRYYYPSQEPVQAPPAQQDGKFSIERLRRIHNGEAQSAPCPPAYEGGYDAPPVPEAYVPYEEAPVFDAYGEAPVCDAYEDAPAAYAQEPAPRKKKKKHRIWKVLLWVLIILLLLALLTAAVLFIFQKMPETSAPIGARKDGCCTVLLAGTDESGMRTDTLMVLFIDRPNKQMRLLSIPRDTMVNRDNPVPKINGAYYANGAGEVGMGYLMDYVKDVIGYRPDGYVLIDLNCFEDLVNLMGGVTFDVPMDMAYEDPSQDLFIDLKAGSQHLNGEQAMWLVRFRSGYAAADLQRVSVQRDFLKAALSQWKRPWNIFRVPAVLSLLSKHTLTDMAWNNFSWLGFSVLLCGTDDLESDTLPGDGAYVNGGAYYVEDRAAAAALVNEKYNPYEEEITAYDLHPYGY